MRQLPANFRPANYLQDGTNPFNLAAPPDSFLRDLFAYDDRLRIFPSAKEAVYRLARVASGIYPWHRLPPGHPDNALVLRHRIIPLKAIQGYKPMWGQIILSELASCDVQRVGGGVAAAELLDQHDELEERRQQLAQDDECDARSSEAYRGLKAQTGSRIHLGTVKPSGAGGTRNPLTARAARAKRVYRPRGAGDHAIFVGR